MADQVMSNEAALRSQLAAAAEATPATSTGVDSGVEEGAYVTKSGSGCVRYAGVTQADYDGGSVRQEQPSRLFGRSPRPNLG